MSPYRLTTLLHKGDKVRIKQNRWGFTREGDIGVLQHQHYTMIGNKMVEAGWIIRVQWQWTWERIFAICFDFITMSWWHMHQFHLFDNEFEVIS